MKIKATDKLTSVRYATLAAVDMDFGIDQYRKLQADEIVEVSHAIGSKLIAMSKAEAVETGVEEVTSNGDSL